MYNIFICYARKDEKYKDELCAQLRGRTWDVTVWADHKIPPGATWSDEIEQALANCNMALLLISIHFLNSEFIQKEELPKLLARNRGGNLTIIPIIVGACPWKDNPELKQLNCFQCNKKPIAELRKPMQETVWNQISDEIAELIENHRSENIQSGPIITTQRDLFHLPISITPLVGRKEILKELDNALMDSTAAVVTVVAPPGLGKSALIYEWLEPFRKQDCLSQKKVYGWSFYSPVSRSIQTSSAQFFEEALPFFGCVIDRQHPLTDVEKGRKLAAQLREQSSLLILDGVEPLQRGRGMIPDEISDPAMCAFIRDIALNGLPSHSMIVITSRQPIVELQGQNWQRERTNIGSSSHRAHHLIELEPMSSKEGAELLKSLGVKGTRSERFGLSIDMGGNPLALILLAGLLVRYCGGDPASHNCIGGLFDIPELKGFQDENIRARKLAQHMMQTIEDQLKGTQENPPELLFLWVLGLFHRPMSEKEWRVLQERHPLFLDCPSVNENTFNDLISRLSAAGLLAEKKKGSTTWREREWDTHSLVREWFGGRFRNERVDDWKKAHRLLFEYFKKESQNVPSPSLKELEPLYRAVYHGCAAGAYRDAFQVYWVSIHREELAYSTNTLGAYAQDLTVLNGFFSDSRWNHPVEDLADEDKDRVAGIASFCLKSVGRLDAAIAAREAHLEIAKRCENWCSVALAAENLTDLLITKGNLKEAKDHATEALDFGKNCENTRTNASIKWHEAYEIHARLGTVLHRQGKLEEAQGEFETAEKILLDKFHAIKPPGLFSLPGRRYCSLLLTRAKTRQEVEKVLNRLKETWSWYDKGGGQLTTTGEKITWLLDRPLMDLTLGRALMRLDGKKWDAEIIRHLDSAVKGMQDAGNIDQLPHALLARARYYRRKNDRRSDSPDLREALEYAERYGMDLYRVDGYLLEINLKLDDILSMEQNRVRDGNHTDKESILKNARALLGEAEGLVERCNYGLREADLHLVRARLYHYEGNQARASNEVESAVKRMKSIGQWAINQEVKAVQAEICEV